MEKQQKQPAALYPNLGDPSWNKQNLNFNANQAAPEYSSQRHVNMTFNGDRANQSNIMRCDSCDHTNNVKENNNFYRQQRGNVLQVYAKMLY